MLDENTPDASSVYNTLCAWVMPTIQVKKIHEAAKLPTKAYKNDAGFDLHVVDDQDFNNGQYVLEPGEQKLFATGLCISIPPGHMAKIEDRSSMGKRGITKFGGIIDASYRNQWFIMLYNSSRFPQTITVGDKIAQFLVLPVPQFEIEEVESLDVTDRNLAGFGSSGK